MDQSENVLWRLVTGIFLRPCLHCILAEYNVTRNKYECEYRESKKNHHGMVFPIKERMPDFGALWREDSSAFSRHPLEMGRVRPAV